MDDYSEGWKNYLDIEQDEVSASVEVLGRFYTHIRRIPAEESLPREERKTGRYGDSRMILEISFRGTGRRLSRNSGGGAQRRRPEFR